MKKGLTKFAAGVFVSGFLLYGAQVGTVNEPIQTEADIAQSLEWYVTLRNQEEETTGGTKKFDFVVKEGYNEDYILADLEVLNNSFYSEEIIGEDTFKDMEEAIENKDFKGMEDNLKVLLDNAKLKEEPKDKEAELGKYKTKLANKVNPITAYRQVKTKGIERELADLTLDWVGNTFVQSIIIGVLIFISMLYGIVGLFTAIFLNKRGRRNGQHKDN